MELKFRGKRKGFEKWLYFDMIHHLSDDSGVLPDFLQYQLDVKTVGQFTGMKDKNGKEIYKGDILYKKTELSGGIENNLIVVCGEAVFDLEKINPRGEEDEVKRMYLKKHWKHSYEIIGNIFENPELLQ